MRNLKRVLSLAMASVMLLGMMVIGAGAADLTDMDKVTNKEAVNLMVDLGIIVGKPDGSYAPTETIDRATMSKLIYFVLMGTADESAFKGISTPLTDVKGNWAEGFINYCYSMKIVAGTGDNTYNPNGKVTTVSAAKMLLVALGYDAKLSNYENDAMWSVNIMRDAQVAGLLNNVGQKASEELTRDNAAQMIYNALFAKTVTPKFQYDMGVKYLEGYTSNATTLGEDAYGLKKITGTVTSVASDKITVTGDDAGSYDIIGTPDMVGKSVTFYTKNSISVTNGNVSYTYKSVYSTKAITSTKSLGVSTNGTTIANLTTSGNSKFIALLDTTPTYYVNGVSSNAAGADAANTGLGVVVTLLDNNNNGKADVVTVNKYTAAKVASYSTKNDGSITFAPAISGTWTSKNVVGFDTVAKNDIVTAVTYDGKLYITKAESVEGKVTKATSASTPVYTVDGNDYKISSLAVSGTTLALGDTKELFLDASGYVIAVETISTEADPIAYVKDIDDVTMAGQQVKLVFTDGTTQVVTVSKLGGNAVATANAVAKNRMVSYKVTDGKYQLTYVADNLFTGDLEDGKAAIGTSGKYGTADTLYVDVANGKSYTGYDNLPTKITLAANGGNMVLDADNANLVTVVFMTSIASSSATTSDELVIYDATYSVTKDADDNIIYTYNAIEKGVPTTVSSVSTLTLTPGIYTSYTKDSDGYIDSVTTSQTFAAAKKAVVLVNGNLIVYNTNVAVSADSATLFFVIENSKVTEGSIGSVEAGDDIIVTTVSNNANLAKYVYIIK